MYSPKTFEGDGASPVKGYFAVLILVAFAMVSSLNFGESMVFNQRTHSMPQWGEAKRVTTKQIAPVGYFRRVFFIDEPVSRAYLMVSASDEFAVYVNGQALGASRQLPPNRTAIYDVAGIVYPGKNIIALKVISYTKGKNPDFIATLRWSSRFGSRSDISSDETWKTHWKEQSVPAVDTTWIDKEFNDFHWDQAVYSRLLRASRNSPLLVPAEVYETLPDGDWIRHSMPGPTPAFKYEFRLDGDALENAWLGVTTTGEYSLSVNDYLLLESDGNERTMEMTTIASFLKEGANEININVRGDNAWPSLSVSGFATLDGEPVRLSSDSKWLSLGYDVGVSAASPVWQEVEVQQSMALYENLHKPPVLVPVKNIPSLDVDIGRAKMFAYATVWVLLFSLLLFIPFHMVLSGIYSMSRMACLEIYSRPYLVGGLLVIQLILVRYILNIDYPFSSRVFFLIICCGIVSAEILLLVEARRMTKR